MLAPAVGHWVGNALKPVHASNSVLVMHQGRHKTTDGEGTAVGGVAAAAAADIGARAKPQVTGSALTHMWC